MKAHEPNLSAERLRSILDYDPDSGVFRWRERAPNSFPNLRLYRSWRTKYLGKIAGKNDSHGHRQIRINGIAHGAHRLAWLHFYGEWPCDQIDHINGVRDDNRIINLRDVSYIENARNACLKKVNRTGVNGVSIISTTGKFRARIRGNDREYHLGVYDTLEEAAAARAEANKRFGYHPNHGRAQ